MGSSARYGERTAARCQALQLLFQADACDRSVDDVLAGDDILVTEGPKGIDPFAAELARGADEHKSKLDAAIAEVSKNWSIGRIAQVDLNLLRLAVYEMTYVDQVDMAVTINEFVRLAKDFGGSDDSFRFVNGLLGQVAHRIEGEGDHAS